MTLQYQGSTGAAPSQHRCLLLEIPYLFHIQSRPPSLGAEFPTTLAPEFASPPGVLPADPLRAPSRAPFPKSFREVRLGSAGSLSQEEQETLAQATEEVMRCQRERDRLEQEHSRALSAYSSARQVPEVGGSLLRPASPRTRKLRERMDELSCQQRRVEELAARAKAAKETYRLSLVELDRTSQGRNARVFP